MSEPVSIALCRHCKKPLEEGLRRNPMKLCQGCIDVAVHKRLFPEFGAGDSLAGVTQIP